MKKDAANDFETLSGIQQVILKPYMWIGSMSPVTQKMFIIKDGNVEYKDVTYIPAFRKIIDEILDNSCDSLIKNCNAKGKIKVVMDVDNIYIEDNGPGIPVIKKDLKDITDSRMSEEEKKRISETYLPEIAWTRLFSGSNFKDSDDKTTVGSHGLGSKCTAIFSTKFVGISDDGKKLCKVVAKNNLEKVETVVSESKGQGVRVKFYPDFKRFGLTKVDDVYKELMLQRLICLGITFPGIKFSFNGKQVNVNDKTFLNLFSEHITFQVFDRGFIGIYPNESDEFNFFTYVDGLALNRGGSHIDYIVDKVVTPIREKLVKKYKTIKPADIKNRLSMVVFLRDFPNLKFDSQTKETLTNLPSEVSKYFGESVDFDKLSRNVLKNEFIVDPIVETFKLKEEVKERVALKQAGKSKVKISVDKYISPIGENKYLFVCEGASSRGGVSAALGRNGFGFYASRGVGINAYDASNAQILKNQEFSDIIKIMGLDITNPKEQNLNFKKFVVTSDADCLEAHTKILTKNGDKELKDIAYGDEVLTCDGSYKRVVNIVEKIVNKTVWIRFDDSMNKVVSSYDHRFIVMRDGVKTEVRASDLRDTDLFLKKTDIDGKFDLVSPVSIETVNDSEEATILIDIEVEDNHTFFFKVGEGDYMLSHNCDGIHITSIYLGWFQKFAPWMFEKGIVCRLTTPIAIVFKDKGMTKIHQMFFDLPSFKEFEKKNDMSKFATQYYKGLGSFPKEMFIKMFNENGGVDEFIQAFKLDESGKVYIDNWLNGEKSDERKRLINDYTFDLDMV